MTNYMVKVPGLCCPNGLLSNFLSKSLGKMVRPAGLEPATPGLGNRIGPLGTWPVSTSHSETGCLLLTVSDPKRPTNLAKVTPVSYTHLTLPTSDLV